jgi:hypothetical protein
MRFPQFTALAIAGALLAAGCGGSGTGSSPGTAAKNSVAPVTAQTKVKATIKLKIPGPGGGSKTASTNRQPKFVANTTDGVLVNVFVAGIDAGVPLGTSSTDVSPESAACGAPAEDGSRACIIVIPAPIGIDDFVFTTYSAPPDGAGSFGTDVAIGSGTVFADTINAAAANSISVTLGGIIASLTVAPSGSLPADGTGHTLPIHVAALDASGATILGTDAYATPISATLLENGATGLSTLTTGALNKPTDPLSIAYNGLGASGYFATVSLASGSATAAFTLDPFFVSSTNVVLDGTVPSVPITLAENGNPRFTTSSLDPPCTTIETTIATISAVASNSFSLTPGATDGSCNVAVSDGTTTRTISVTNSTSQSTITVPPGPLSHSHGASH